MFIVAFLCTSIGTSLSQPLPILVSHLVEADLHFLGVVSLDVIPSGPSVRLGNLPKKKNIHRDLQAAFKGFKGIVKISPAVTGNWKTRDPVCKGFAYVELVSEEAAIR